MSQPARRADPSPLRTKSALPIIICTLLIAMFSATAWLASLHESATTDEPVSLFSSWAVAHLQDFRSDSENPPLWKYYVGSATSTADFAATTNSPGWRQLLTDNTSEGSLASSALYSTPGLDADTLIHRARARMILLGALLAATIAWWAWRIAGPFAAIVATAFFCLDPNFLAHTPLIKNDVPETLVFLWLMAITWLTGQRATFPRLSLLAVALAAALMTKFSGVLAIPILFTLLLVRSLLPTPWTIGGWTAATRLRRLATSSTIFVCVVLITWGLTWASYDFRFNPTADAADAFDFHAALQTCAAHECLAESIDPFNISPQAIHAFVSNWTPPLPLRLVLAANDHHLLPQSSLRGLVGVYAWSRGRVAYLCGQSSVIGWWYYFPAAFAFKTPLATLAALTIAIIIVTKRIPRLNPPAIWTLSAALIPPSFYLIYAMTSRVDVGIRHIFPIYPFLFILIGVAASIACKTRPKLTAILSAAFILALAIKTASAFPNFIPFFNRAAGGSRGGFQLLSDSNLDWGQDLPALAQWQRENPRHQLYLCYWGSADPRYYGIHYINLPASDAPPDQLIPARLPPAYVFSAVALTQPGIRKLYKPLLDELQKRPPITTLDGSLFIYLAPQ
jgi:hypothetical protein